MRLFLLLFASSFFLLAEASRAETFALLVNGGANKDKNGVGFHEDLRVFYETLRFRGVPRDHVVGVEADGAQGGANSYEQHLYNFFPKPRQTPASFENDSVRDVRYPGTRKGIEDALEDLRPRLRAGDHLVIYLDGHGEKDGYVLWGGDRYTPEQIESTLAKLPGSVTVHIIADYCFSGHLLRIRLPNVCAMTSVSDQLTSATAYATPGVEYNSFPNGLKLALQGKPIDPLSYKGKPNPKSTLLEGYLAGKSLDMKNGHDTHTSLEWYLDHTSVGEPPAQAGPCVMPVEGPLGRMQAFFFQATARLSGAKDDRRTELEKTLKSRLAGIESFLGAQGPALEQKRARLRARLLELQARYSSLDPAQQEQRRPEMTRLAEQIMAEDDAQKKLLENLPEEQRRLLRELRFLHEANEKQWEHYQSIKRCQNYAL